MNYFSVANQNLNLLFGEIVSIRVSFYLDIDGEEQYLTYISWKRKNASIPSSTNAFHMHRGLCGAFEKLTFAFNLSSKCKKKVKSALKDFVLSSYVNRINDNTQYYEAKITFFEDSSCPNGRYTFDIVEIR